MVVTLRMGALIAALSLAGPTWALDMCFEAQDFLFVAKSYKRPSRGKCRPLTGYEASTTIPHPASGTVCLNAAGNKLYAQWTAVLAESASIPSHLGVRTELPYPSLTGGRTAGCRLDNGSGSQSTCFTTAPQAAFPCVPAPLP